MNKLGVAKLNSSFISKLFLFWIDPLIAKCRISNTNELFELPFSIQSRFNHKKLQFVDFLSIETLFTTFKKDFLRALLIKFIAELSLIMSPFLLNQLNSLFTLSILTLTTICHSHCMLLLGELKLKVQAALISKLYSHINVNVSENGINDGEMTNIITSDIRYIAEVFKYLTDIIVTPFQICVILYLLHDHCLTLIIL